jgi:hypothetical protein
MSVEAIPMEYLFHPAKEPQYPSFDKGGVYEEHPHFHHNALHDIELAWWVGVWMLVVLSYKPKEHEDQTKDLSQLCQNETNQIFPGTLAHGTRLLYIMWTTEFLSSTKKWILVELFPAVKVFDYVCNKLLKLYQEVEATLPSSHLKLLARAD